MRKKEKILNEMELEVMKLFWEDPLPKASADIQERLSFGALSYINKVLNSLVRKGMLVSDTYRKEGNHNVRLFQAGSSKEEYAAVLLDDLDIRPAHLPDVAVALTKKVSANDFSDMEAELEDVLTEFVSKKCTEDSSSGRKGIKKK